MPKKELFTVPCKNCQNTFPIVLLIDTDEEENETNATSKEVSCPHCNTRLHIKSPGTLMSDDDIVRKIDFD